MFGCETSSKVCSQPHLDTNISGDFATFHWGLCNISLGNSATSENPRKPVLRPKPKYTPTNGSTGGRTKQGVGGGGLLDVPLEVGAGDGAVHVTRVQRRILDSRLGSHDRLGSSASVASRCRDNVPVCSGVFPGYVPESERLRSGREVARQADSAGFERGGGEGGVGGYLQARAARERCSRQVETYYNPIPMSGVF